MTQTQVVVPYQENYDFGVGVDLATASPMGKVVEGVVSGVTGAEGSTTSFLITRIENSHDLETALGIDVDASGGSGCFGASDRMNFVNKVGVHEKCLVLGIIAGVTLHNLSIDAPSLTAPAVEIASRDDVFSTRFGNMFVRGIKRGGIFVGAIKISTKLATDSDSISNDFSGSYGAFSAKAKTTFSKIEADYHSEMRIFVYHIGGPINLTMGELDDPNQLYVMLQQWLQAFQDDPDKNAVPYSVSLAPIAIANGPIPANEAELQHVQDVLKFCARERSRLFDGLNLMEDILQNPARYDYVAPTTPADITKAFDGYQSDLQLLADAASHAINNVTDALMPAEFAQKSGKAYPQGVPPMPMPTLQKGMLDVLAAAGEALANQDPLAVALRNPLPSGGQRGFNIAYGTDPGGTAPGPEKDKIRETLPPAEQVGFNIAVSYFAMRNQNLSLATVGAAIAQHDPRVADAHASEKADSYFALGFDIATGLYGDPALGGQGIAGIVPGPGQTRIYNTLNLFAQKGFDASKTLHFGPPPLKRGG